MTRKALAAFVSVLLTSILCGSFVSEKGTAAQTNLINPQIVLYTNSWGVTTTNKPHMTNNPTDSAWKQARLLRAEQMMRTNTVSANRP